MATQSKPQAAPAAAAPKPMTKAEIAAAEKDGVKLYHLRSGATFATRKDRRAARAAAKGQA